jgi:hypothetical protein
MSPKLKEAIKLIFSAIEDVDARLEAVTKAIERKQLINQSNLATEAAKIKITKEHRWKTLRTKLEAAIEAEGGESEIDTQLKHL